jgi:hypothetical protein
VRVITLVREPIADNISMFFQLLDHYLRSRDLGEQPSIALLHEIFLSEYIHTRPIIWLDAELKTTLNVDVYGHAFPKERGHVRISTEKVDLLVLKCEIDDETKSRAIADFLGLEELELVRSNVAENKSYADTYQQFKERIKIPEPLLSRMYESKYAQHFYSPEEIVRFRKRWSGGS